ncbi:MAG: 4Fe-4S binding protein [Thermodesulfobacteriota bacterium]
MKETIKTWLKEGLVDVFIGYRNMAGHPIPCFFSRENIEDLENLVEGPARYPLEKMALKLAAGRSGVKIGLAARDCAQRALNVLYTYNQLDPDRIRVINLNCCPSPLKDRADCSYLKAEPAGERKKAVGVDNNLDLEDLEALPPEERFRRWCYEFEKCIKCHGCRDVCPVCFCKECGLEHPDLITPGRLPVETPLFHLVRAVHMAGRCIDCGLCEEACPMDIPLRLLYRKVNRITERLFAYRPGAGRDLPPFSVLGEEPPVMEVEVKGAA